MGLLYGRAGRLPVKNGGFRPRRAVGCAERAWIIDRHIAWADNFVLTGSRLGAATAAGGAAGTTVVWRLSPQTPTEFAPRIAGTGLDEGLLPLSLCNLLYMENPYSYTKFQRRITTPPRVSTQASARTASPAGATSPARSSCGSRRPAGRAVGGRVI
jgi:hypothetical protein